MKAICLLLFPNFIFLLPVFLFCPSSPPPVLLCRLPHGKLCVLLKITLPAMMFSSLFTEITSEAGQGLFPVPEGSVPISLKHWGIYGAGSPCSGPPHGWFCLQGLPREEPVLGASWQGPQTALPVIVELPGIVCTLTGMSNQIRVGLIEESDITLTGS